MFGFHQCCFMDGRTFVHQCNPCRMKTPASSVVTFVFGIFLFDVVVGTHTCASSVDTQYQRRAAKLPVPLVPSRREKRIPRRITTPVVPHVGVCERVWSLFLRVCEILPDLALTPRWARNTSLSRVTFWTAACMPCSLSK